MNRTFLGLVALAALLSATVYCAFFAAIGDPMGMVGELGPGYAAGVGYYRPTLVAAMFVLAALSPEASFATAPVFLVTQFVAWIVCGTFWVPASRALFHQAMWPLAFAMVFPDQGLWVVVGAVLGAGVSLAVRAIRRRTR
jgi:hypothetical protein